MVQIYTQLCTGMTSNSVSKRIEAIFPGKSAEMHALIREIVIEEIKSVWTSGKMMPVDWIESTVVDYRFNELLAQQKLAPKKVEPKKRDNTWTEDDWEANSMDDEEHPRGGDGRANGRKSTGRGRQNDGRHYY